MVVIRVATDVLAASFGEHVHEQEHKLSLNCLVITNSKARALHSVSRSLTYFEAQYCLVPVEAGQENRTGDHQAHMYKRMRNRFA